jgi:hypothetical protein
MRLTTLAVVLLLSSHAGLLAYAATRHSPTVDEPGHLVAGLSNWEFGRFELYRVNPPLTRLVAALPVLLAGYEADWNWFFDAPGARMEFAVAQDFFAANRERSVWLFTIGRWACIVFSVLGGLFCYGWARELAGRDVGGLIALALWCFDPNILAHAALITPDGAAASFGVGAAYFFWRWLRQPAWNRAFAAGLLLALAELSKMSWIILFGIWPALWLFWLWTERSHSKQSPPLQGAGMHSKLHHFRHWRQGAFILVLAVYLLNLAYKCEGTFTKLGDFEFVSSALSGNSMTPDRQPPNNRFRGTWLAKIPIPLPSNYIRGIDVQKRDFEHFRHDSFLRGEWKHGGWWYYYAYGLAVKVPHGTQLLVLWMVISMAAAYRRRGPACAAPQPGPAPRDVVVLLTPAAVLFVLVSSQQEFNHHFRYVLPAFGFLFVLIGAVLSRHFAGEPSRAMKSG